MGTWVSKSFRLDPWSYRNLLLKAQALQAKNDREGRHQTVNPSVALRYILRRVRLDGPLPCVRSAQDVEPPRGETVAQRRLRVGTNRS